MCVYSVPLGNTTAQSFRLKCPQLDLRAATPKIRTFHSYVSASAYRRVDLHIWFQASRFHTLWPKQSPVFLVIPPQGALLYKGHHPVTLKGRYSIASCWQPISKISAFCNKETSQFPDMLNAITFLNIPHKDDNRAPNTKLKKKRKWGHISHHGICIKLNSCLFLL